MLSDVKITPLVTGFVMPDKDKKVIAQRFEKNAPSGLMHATEKLVKGVKWLEGPVDKYGLSYYLSSRITGVAAICVTAYLVQHGVDVGAYLTTWGVLGEGVGEAAGTAAAASILNLSFLPLHFYSSVYGVRALESRINAAAKGIVDGKIEAERNFGRDHIGCGNNEKEHIHNDDKSQERWDDGDRENESEYRESEYERISEGTMKTAIMLLLTYSLMVSLYSFRLFGKTAMEPWRSNVEGGNAEGNDEDDNNHQNQGEERAANGSPRALVCVPSLQ